MRLFLITIIIATCLSAGLGIYAENAYSLDKTESEEKTGHKMETSPNVERAPYDLQFMDTMILHHRSAITMAKLAVNQSENVKLKQLSNKIITEQTTDIADMEKLRAALYPTQNKAENMEMKGMKTSIEDMDMEKLKAANNADFDKLYIQMMTTHQQGGIAMAKDAITQLADSRLKTLANNIITTQTTEMAQLKVIYTSLQ